MHFMAFLNANAIPEGLHAVDWAPMQEKAFSTTRKTAWSLANVNG